MSVSLTQQLKNEIVSEKGYRFCREFFQAKAIEKYRGRQELTSELCAAVFLSGSYIYKNDLIVGSQRSLYLPITSEKEQEYRDVCKTIHMRDFPKNDSHFAPDYAMMVSKGVIGILDNLENSLLTYAGNRKKMDVLKRMKQAMTSFLRLIVLYREKAESLIGTDGYSESNLKFIINNLRILESGAPNSFSSALQLVWLCHTAFGLEGRYAMALGTMDRYLRPFFEADLQNGVLTRKNAVDLLANAFIKITERNVLIGDDDVVNICIGGIDSSRHDMVNELSYCILDAVRECNVPGPNLSARIASENPDRFLDECLKLTGTGLGYPAMMNDEVNLTALSRYGYEKEDLYSYCMVGCIENFIPGKQPAWSDGRFDTPRYFEYLFNRGQGIFNANDFCLDTGDVSEIKSMAELLVRYKKLLAVGVKDYVNKFEKRAYTGDWPEEELYSPFLSCFCSECIERGEDINLGGTKYPSVHGACIMGIGTVCDSLAAIEKTVFMDHTTTLDELGQALKANFEGYEGLRSELLAAPKYGNDNPLPDKYAPDIVDFMFSEFSKYHTPDGGYYYLAMAANTANIYSGRITAATPDGRKSGVPISDASSPSFGKDVSGETAVFLSCSKPDLTKAACGSVLNRKYMPSMFEPEKREKLLKVIRTYFAMGGQEVQINATSTETLLDAMNHPEDYGNLIVRVSGFSAYYVQLDRAVQEDILARTVADL